MTGLSTYLRNAFFSFVVGICLVCQLQAADLPQNIGGNLRRLIVASSRQGPGVNLHSVRLALNSANNRYELMPGKPNIMADPQNRVLVRIVLDGTVAVPDAEAEIGKQGGQVVASSTFARGLISAYIPLTSATSLSQAAGIKSVHLSIKPQSNVGAVTSQAVLAQHVDEVHAQGHTGKGITVGIISDSFNTSGSSDTAADDVATGDLPNTTAIQGGEGLKALIQDWPNRTDEGRAMAQIVHDMAPGAALCFATAEGGEVNFANNIVKLASDNGPCNADIIVDDETYFAEPFFSDGVIADAINFVSTARKQNGRRVAYFSSAGNLQDEGFASEFRPISAKVAAQLPNTPVDLSTVPNTLDVSGGLHNFAKNGDIVIAQPLFIFGNPILVFEWNDPFDIGQITTSYSLLLFDQNGQFIQASDIDLNASAADNAFLIDEPIQAIFFDTSQTPNNAAFYYLVIARTGEGTHRAKQMKYVMFSDGQAAAPYITNDVPTIVGHHGAHHNIAVAAYQDNPPPFFPDPPYAPQLESFSSPGPFTNYFDRDGDRLREPEVRAKPEIACSDGVFTTFFGQTGFLPTDKFPRFYGTSAAAPCAAGIAALMLDKARSRHDHGSLSPGALLDALRYSVASHDTDPFLVHGRSFLNDGGVLSIKVRGNNNQVGDPSNFRVQLKDAGSWRLIQLDLKIESSDELLFFNNANFPFTVGNTSPGVTVDLLNLMPPPGVTAQSTTLSLSFTGLKSGDFAQFDVDRAEPFFHYIDDDADRLGGTPYTALLENAQGEKLTLTGSLNSRHEDDEWNPFDGFGLIDAQLAVANVP